MMKSLGTLSLVAMAIGGCAGVRAPEPQYGPFSPSEIAVACELTDRLRTALWSIHAPDEANGDHSRVQTMRNTVTSKGLPPTLSCPSGQRRMWSRGQKDGLFGFGISNDGAVALVEAIDTDTMLDCVFEKSGARWERVGCTAAATIDWAH